MVRILCFGDSNTWGYISGTDHLRFNETERWTKLLQKKLGSEFEIIEEGLNSRTLFSDDLRPGKEGRNGFKYLKPCMDSHDKLDIIILMLGTNELKFEFNNSAEDILDMLKMYIEFISGYKSQIDGSTPKLIISGLPIVTETTDYCNAKNKYINAHNKSIKLNELLKNYCKSNNILFIENSELETGVDGVHLTLESHKLLANKLCNAVKNLK